MKIRKGIFITFEGPDGSGKTTNSLLLCKYLRGKGFRVLFTREPGGTKISESIRRLLLRSKSYIAPVSELLLYAASRFQHVDEVIRPALNRKEIVVCDRYSDATLAYQGYGRGIDPVLIKTLDRIATGGLKPDLTILLDIPAREGLERGKSRSRAKDRMEREKISFHDSVRSGYLEIARNEPGRIKVIRSSRVIKETSGKVIAIVNDFLGGKSR